MTSRPDTGILYELSVIVARVDPGVPLSRSVAALARACANLHVEILVVDATGAVTDARPEGATPVRVLRVGAGALVPQLWTHGLAYARGDNVAFTLANCEVAAGWALEMLAALQAGASGVGGPLERAPGLGVVDRAVYYLRYSAFLPSRVSDGPVPGDIAGDNAAYRHEVLRRHREAIADGFWEVLFHKQLRSQGGSLAMRRGAAARFLGGVGFRDAIRHRFAHGRHFGDWRVSARQRPWWLIVLAAPLVPVLLSVRAFGRVKRSDWWPLVSALPVFLAIASAWAAGEAVGATRGARLPRVQSFGQQAYVPDRVRSNLAPRP